MSYPHDYHLHSLFSCDSQTPMTETCQAALGRGMTEIGFADHFDSIPLDSCYNYFRLEPWAAALEDCRRQFSGSLVIRAGVEIGEPHRYAAEAAGLLAQYPFDYVIGSLHWVGEELTLEAPYFRRPADEAFRLYFEELEKMTRLGDFDIVGHFDVVTRAGYTAYGAYDPRRYEDVIRAALKHCVERGLALELNTSAVRRSLKEVTPGIEILRWYTAMGGERVTLGSDAHRAVRVAEDFDVALDNLRAAGLKYVTQFEGRQAKLVAIGP